MLYFSSEVIYSHGWPMKIVVKTKLDIFYINFISKAIQNMFAYYIKESWIWNTQKIVKLGWKINVKSNFKNHLIILRSSKIVANTKMHRGHRGPVCVVIGFKKKTYVISAYHHSDVVSLIPDQARYTNVMW